MRRKAKPKKKKVQPKAKKEPISIARGKRKESIARARIKRGKGTLRINSRTLDSYSNKYLALLISEPLRLAGELRNELDVDVVVHGGGEVGQAQACRSAIARALVKFTGDEELKKRMIEHDRFLLTEDYRRVEPKKYKGPKARARFQKSYR